MNSMRRPLAKKTLVRDAQTVVATCAGLNARFAARRITQFLERRTVSSGLSVAQFALMAHVAAASVDTLGELAARMGLDQSTLSRSLRGLEKHGFVEIATIETDLRQRSVGLTEAGALRLEAALPIRCRAHASVAKLVEPDRVGNLATATEILFDGAF
jgi:DNA-binding MarR family transcriptional regulator